MSIKLDLNDHARLRHHRDRYLGFPLGQYIQPPAMLFNRDGLNIFTADTYKGNSAFLILGGPSFGELLKGETELNGNKLSNKDLLNGPGFVTMATNNAPKSFRPNLWTIVDDPGNFIKSIWLDPKITKYVPFDHAEKRIFDNVNWKESDVIVGECPNVLFYRRNEHFVPEQFLWEGSFNWGEHSDALDTLGNKGGRSVMLVALKLLYYLGIRKVFLLGCDFKMDANTTYHFDQDRSIDSQKGNNSTYNILKKRFTALLPYFEQEGFQIFNCNSESELKVFPFMPFNEAIKIATREMPDIKNERTSGLYDRRSQQRNKVKKVTTKTEQPPNIDLTKKSFTEEEKNTVKNELDKRRSLLNELKHQRDIYKLMPDKNEDNLLALEKSIQNARQSFKEYEIIKNKVWALM